MRQRKFLKQMLQEDAMQDVARVFDNNLITEIVDFTQAEIPLKKCIMFGCPELACGQTSQTCGGTNQHLRCNKPACTNLCAWNDGMERCGNQRLFGHRGGTKFCRGDWCNAFGQTREEFRAAKKAKENAGEKF